jgi:hypothetical protein
MERKKKDRPWRVFRFMFTAQKKQRRAAVASVNRTEAKKLILASFRNVSFIQEIV